jgi:uncharacterized membrane protein
MLTGILIAIATGLLWTLIGIIMSNCSRYGLNFRSYSVINSFFTLLFTMLIYVRWDVVVTWKIMNPYPLICLIAGAGVFSSIGLFVMQSAMTRGHNGIIWTFGQSALIFPFLAGIFIFGEQAGVFKIIGVILILTGMILPSIVKKSKAETVNKPDNSKVWLKFALLAFLLCGISQTLQSVPSYWQGWQDNANIRPSLVCLGTFVGVMAYVVIVRNRFMLEKRTLILAIGMAVINTLSIKLFYVALDCLAVYGIVSIGFPLSIGACIIGFSVYSIIVIREKTHCIDWMGLSSTITGIVVISR